MSDSEIRNGEDDALALADAELGVDDLRDGADYDFPASGGNGLTEYETSGGEFWAVEDFPGLGERFSMGAGDLPAWHDLMSRQGRAWDVVRSLYGVCGLLDVEPVLTIKEIAKGYGVKVGQIELEMETALRVWKLSRARDAVSHEAVAGISREDFDRLTSFSRTDGLSGEMVESLLKAFNFAEVKDEELKAQVAGRILSLRQHLQNPHTRMQARGIIRMEITMHGYERLQNRYQNELDAALDEDPTLIAKKSEVEGFRAKVEEIDKNMAKLGKDHAALQKAIGADENDFTTSKKLAVDTAAYLMEQCRIYESDPENWKPDGTFTAGEIHWQMEPSGDRLPQYRPDVSLRLDECMKPENLWDPKFVPTPIQKGVTQKLRQMVEAVAEMRDKDKVEREADEDEWADDEEGLANAGDAALVRVSLEDDAGGVGVPEHSYGPRAGGGDEVMGVF